MSVRQGSKTIAGHTGCHFDLFDHKWADHILDDPSWLRADTFSWQSGAVYQAAYQHLVDDVNNSTSTGSDTISGVTIYYFIAPDGHKIVWADQESNVVAIYNASGVAWYYILDMENQRFKLPRTKFGFTGLRNGVGNYVSPGLPNITGWARLNDDLAFADGGGALYLSNSYSRDVASNRSGSQNHNVNIDASRSSSIYGNSTTVQTPATQMYLYFYVGNFIQAALENTAGLNAELFNGKADIDFNNTSMIDYVIAKQEPGAGNNYTWYRKYKSGWVEQGGRWSHSTGTMYQTLPIAMSDTSYDVIGSFGSGYSPALNNNFVLYAYSSTQICLQDNNSGTMNWVVYGKAA